MSGKGIAVVTGGIFMAACTAQPADTQQVDLRAIGRRRIVSVPVTASASSIPAGSKCLIRFGYARAVNSEVNSSALVNVPWAGATNRSMILQTPSG